MTMEHHMTEVLDTEGVGPEKCSIQERQLELGCMHWGVSLQPPKVSVKALNSHSGECYWFPYRKR